MKLQNDPQSNTEEQIIDATLDALNDVDPTNDIYPHDHIYFNTSDAQGDEIALLKFEFFPEIPDTEFGRGKSSLQMKEEFEEALQDTLPQEITFERKTKLQFAFYKK